MKLPNFFLVALSALSMIPAMQGCYHQHAVEVARESIPDSVQGVVSVTGTAFEHRLVLRAANKAILLAADSADSAALTNLAGVETRVRGRLDGGAMHVQNFTALRVDGAPVVDGILIDRSGQLFLKTLDGLWLIGNPPSRLREMISARVWIGGPLDTGPNNYGVIVPAVGF